MAARRVFGLSPRPPELPTRFRRIVVTDDEGRYVIPDLPQADYSVWVRGYGLVDSPRLRAKPGQRLNLAAAAAPSAADAAHYYPAIYWYSLLTIPDKKEFGGENGIPAHVTQQDWLVTNNHNMMLDRKGRIWLTASVRGLDNPALTVGSRLSVEIRSCRYLSGRPQSHSVILQKGLRPSLGKAVSIGAEPSPARDARSQDHEADLCRYLFRHPPSAVRFRQG
jgi:hypothetical protein